MLDFGVIQRLHSTALRGFRYYKSTRNFLDGLSSLQIISLDIEIQMISLELSVSLRDERLNLREFRPDVKLPKIH